MFLKNGPILVTPPHFSLAENKLWEMQPQGKHKDAFQSTAAEAMGQ